MGRRGGGAEVNFLFNLFLPDDPTPAYDVWDLPERLFFEVFGRFVFAFRHIDRDELEWDLLFVQDRDNATRAC